MNRHRETKWLSLGAIAVAFGLIAAACGDSGSTTAATDTTQAPATTAATATTAGAEAATTTAAPGILSECESPIVIQSDWFPESEHGAVYNLVGDGYTVDTDNLIVKGNLVVQGQDTGVDIEIRTGGPGIGFQPVDSQMYTDTDIDLGFLATETQLLLHDDAPTVSVIAPLDKSPQMIMWDPATYPDVKTIADLKPLGVTINVFGGGTFGPVLANEGVIDPDQLDQSYDGSPARFIAAQGSIAQQGFASAEPFQYENVFQDWAKPVAFQLIHDAGLQVYISSLGVRERDLEPMAPCLEQLVPVIQQSIVDFYANPDHANSIIIDAVEKFGSFWTYDQPLADFSVKAQLDLGLASNGPNDTVGDMIPERVQQVIDEVVAAVPDAPTDVSAADISTNRFIDPSIGLP